MFIVDQYSTAVILCVITMICWGSWANTTKLTSPSWRFELFYWDYVIGILITSLLLALTLGSMGEGGRAFLPDLLQADRSNLFSAVIGGVVFNAANILLGASIDIAGMAVAFPVGIGLALVIGVIVNYLDAPVGDAGLLFTGVALVAIAIIMNAVAYRRTGKGSSGVSTKGLILALVSGSMMGLFYRYVAASMFPDFNMPMEGKLSPYSAVLLFSVGILLSNVIFNSLMMIRPFRGEPVRYAQYFAGSRRDHLMGMLGGLIWCIGMSFNMIASGAAGPAISYGLGQGATVVAAIWGIHVWKEFHGSPPGTGRLLGIMLLSYVAGLALIIAAR